MASPGAIPLLRVVIGSSPADRRDFVFQQPFRIGRARDCEVPIQNEFISRAHAAVRSGTGSGGSSTTAASTACSCFDAPLGYLEKR